jgi:transcription elongation factor Elf1
MNDPKYMLICNNCGQKHFTDGQDTTGLVEVQKAPLPKNANGRDKSFYEMPKRFKCYNCGHLFRTIPLKPGEVKKEEKKEERKEVPDDEYLKNWENECLRSIRNRRPMS